MKIIVGLGNPGKKHKKTRHNAGFMAIDKIKNEKFPPKAGPPLAEKMKNYNSKLKIMKKFKSEIIERKVGGKKVLLVKPLTYMNNCGQAVKSIISQFRPPAGEAGNFAISNLIVIHDDVDLPLGRIKVKRGGGSAGHHGVESIIKELGTAGFVRVRLGIGRNGDVEEFVLLPFKKKEKEEVENMLNKACEQIYSLL